MIRAIIKFSAENRYIVIALAIVALAYSVYSMRTIPLDALPELSDTQVIIYSRWDRSPDLLEDQVTYPIITSLLGAPKVKAIRGFSDFGYSFVYVIFEDGTDPYWARTRVLEYLSKISSQLPTGVRTELGPDASSVGWVFQYTLVDRTGKHSSDELRSYQDWFLRYSVQAVPGVAEVATVGGQVRQYQVNVDPTKLASLGLSIQQVVDAVRAGNGDVGGRLVELTGREYMVRGRGYVKQLSDLEQLVLRAEGGTPVMVKDVATVALGPELRRGVADLDGEGDVVGGIVVMREGENALNVINAVKKKLGEVSLPEGVEVLTTYDRSELILSAIDTVTDKLIEEILIVSLIILVFLWHFPSSIVPIITIPVSVALAFIPMKLMGLNANLMSLAGIAISIGVLMAVPFSAVGALLLLTVLGYNMSIAVWVGLIALMGLDAETGVFMLLFLDLSLEDARKRGALRNVHDLKEAIVHGAVKRVRPKAMTVLAAMMGLLPIMWSTGAGADLMKRIAAPMVGGLTTSFLLELLVYPAVYLLWKQHSVSREEEIAAVALAS